MSNIFLIFFEILFSTNLSKTGTSFLCRALAHLYITTSWFYVSNIFLKIFKKFFDTFVELCFLCVVP